MSDTHLSTLSVRDISPSMIFVDNIPVDAKLDDILRSFVTLRPQFSGSVTVFKDTQYLERDGSTHVRQYQYDVECGKYRKHRYDNSSKWKLVVVETV